MWDFTFNGEKASDKNIIVNSIIRPILPTLRPRKMTIPGKDGTWDFGNNTYDEQIVRVVCTMLRPFKIQDQIRDIARWLSQKGNVVFSDEPDKYYTGRIYSEITQNIMGSQGQFVIPFICDPHAYSLVKTTDEILLGSDISLGANITLNNADDYTFALVGPSSFNVENFGNKDIKPTIIINGSFDNITIAINGKNLTYESAINNQELIIDGDHYTAELDGVNKLSELSGDVNNFLTLQPNSNNVVITGTNINCTMRFEFRPTFY
jgi:predicted phage tail component-like protein